MRKLLIPIILVLLFIPVVVNAAACDPSKVYIDSIGIENTKGLVTELDEGTVKDKKINLNLRMSAKDDEILYKLVIKNDSEDDYEINKNNIILSSDYIDYSLESDNNNIVKKKSSKTIYLRVKYSKEVDESKFVNGVYQDDITMKVNLKSDDIPNPNTGIPYIIIISLILIIGGIYLIIIIGVLLLPIGVKALCTCEIVVDSKVTIKVEEQFKITSVGCSSSQNKTNIYTYRIGMTFNEFLYSNYVETLDLDNKFFIENLLHFNSDIRPYVVDNKYNDCMASIDRPADESIYTQEELNQIYTEINRQETECFRTYYKEFNLNDKIISMDKASYEILSDNCPV